MNFRSRLKFLASLTLLLGCSQGISQEELDATRNAIDLFNQGLTAFNSRDYATAAQKLSQATNSDSLGVGFRETALIKLATAQAASGDAGAGLATLQAMESQYKFFEDEVGFLVAKTYVLQKQGDRSGASQTWRQARSLRPRVKRFRE